MLLLSLCQGYLFVSCNFLRVVESRDFTKMKRHVLLYPGKNPCISCRHLQRNEQQLCPNMLAPPLWQAEKLCGSVELGLGPDAPLLVKYDLESGENGHMKFYLAPKIDE